MPDGLSLFGFFYCLPEDLAGSFHAFLIGVGIHSQRYRFVAVAQLFRYAGYICTVCNGNTGKGMPQIVEADVRESGVLQDFLWRFTTKPRWYISPVMGEGNK